MQFLWKYIDDILGKGFSVFEILELIFYYGLTIIPMALPISILIASVMVFGDMSEKHELPTLKSAGVSLLRIMRGGIILAALTFMFSIFASNYLKPAASFKFKKRFDIITKQKSTLNIEEKIFNGDFNNFIIRVNEKSKDGKVMKDVLIYDHTKPDKSLINLISSDSAEMYSTEDGRYFVMNLFEGIQYQEDNRTKRKDGSTKYPMMKTQFESYKKVLDMSEFYLDENDLNLNRRREDMLNTFQLFDAIDSIGREEKEALASNQYDFRELTNRSELPSRATMESLINPQNDTLTESDKITEKEKKKKRNRSSRLTGVKQIQYQNLDSLLSFFDLIDEVDQYNVISRAASIASSRTDIGFNTLNRMKSLDKRKEAYKLRLHQQYSFATVCLIFFFIGAPLGSIIRKGGYGYPLLIAILYYMVFIISSIMGEKLLRSATFDGMMGAWIPCILLLPFALLFTHKALNDVKFYLSNRMIAFFNRFRRDN
jgi:lipopolysaccharide export system permease protein